ncbi:MAG TPA: transcription elongation factor GreA [Chthonomonadales bacterium]|nr:transcription elongation factor GreA [Chthonomonadales bacterium]
MSNRIVLTEGSYRKLREELEQLKSVSRPQIAESLRKARAYGDLSENFEYHTARRDQAILNGRIADIERTLEVAEVVSDEATSGDVAGLGSFLRVRDLDEEEEWELVLVDPVQADPINDRISAQSPVGQGLMGKRAGDVVEVVIPAGTARYEVLEVRDA